MTTRLREPAEAAIERLNGLVVISQDGSGYDTQWDYDTAQIASELHAALREQPKRVPLMQEGHSVKHREVLGSLQYIRTHLYAAQVQMVPGDDVIIGRHVYDAYRRTAELCKEIELHGITGDSDET